MMGDAKSRIVYHAIHEIIPDATGDIDDIPLNDLAVESLDFYEMLSDLEDEHGIYIDIEQMNPRVTVNSLIELIV